MGGSAPRRRSRATTPEDQGPRLFPEAAHQPQGRLAGLHLAGGLVAGGPPPRCQPAEPVPVQGQPLAQAVIVLDAVAPLLLVHLGHRTLQQTQAGLAGHKSGSLHVTKALAPLTA